MKKNIILLILSSMLLSSCGHYYSIATSQMPAADYAILESGDSSIRILPTAYSFERTPEVIREYSRVIPIDSLTKIIKKSGSTGYTFAGAFGGIVVGAAVGYLSYRKPTCDFCFDFGPGVDALGGALLGMIPGAVIGYILAPADEDMLPKIRRRK
jgi:hypothetical protein